MEDLKQQLLESLVNDDKTTFEQSSTSTKKAESAKEKIVSNGSGALSKLDLGQDSCHKGKAVMAGRVKKEPESRSSAEKKGRTHGQRV